MNHNYNEFLKLPLSTMRVWVITFTMIWLLGSIGLGWLIQSFLILIALSLITPIIAIIAVKWWISRNLIEDTCPVCNYQFMALNQSEVSCPNCTEPLLIEAGHFKRLTPPGTIDVEAVEVSAIVEE